MQILHNVQMQPYNSLRTQSSAKLFCQPTNAEQLTDVLKQYGHEQKLIIGSGCNLFFTHDFDGLIIKPAMMSTTIVAEDDNLVTIEAGAGEDWDTFVEYCVSNNYAGLENLSLIPGTVGAAPVQNIGAYGAEVKDTITSVKAVDIETGEAMTLTNAQCQFEYRNSIFKRTNRYAITAVTFRLNKTFEYRQRYADLNAQLQHTPSPSIAQVRQAVIDIRKRKLPDHNLLPNAGSFFKNPVLTANEKQHLLSTLPQAPIFETANNMFKTSAAYLIDSAGMKGHREGDVGIYENHALILVNYGTANGAEILAFVEKIQQTILRKYGIMLEPEVRCF